MLKKIREKQSVHVMLRDEFWENQLGGTFDFRFHILNIFFAKCDGNFIEARFVF